MRKHEWVTPLIVLTLTWCMLGVVAATVHHNKHQQGTKSFRVI